MPEGLNHEAMKESENGNTGDVLETTDKVIAADADVAAEKDIEEIAKGEPVRRPHREARPGRAGALANDSYDGKDSMRSRYRKKMCRFCADKNYKLSYRETNVLGNFITERGKILPRRITGTCAKHQRDVSRAIKRARVLAVLPFTVK